MHHPTDRIIHTTAFVTPVVEHWQERKITQWVCSRVYLHFDHCHLAIVYSNCKVSIVIFCRCPSLIKTHVQFAPEPHHHSLLTHKTVHTIILELQEHRVDLVDPGRAPGEGEPVACHGVPAPHRPEPTALVLPHVVLQHCGVVNKRVDLSVAQNILYQKWHEQLFDNIKCMQYII